MIIVMITTTIRLDKIFNVRIETSKLKINKTYRSTTAENRQAQKLRKKTDRESVKVSAITMSLLGEVYAYTRRFKETMTSLTPDTF